MKEQTIVQNILTELDGALPSGVTVRTRGGDANASPDLCLVGWSARRLPDENGANPHAEVERDENGDATGRELHRYSKAELDVTVRAYDESDRDTWLSDLQDHFLPYEYDAEGFHQDTGEWSVGDPEPRENAVVEPDWYEGGLEISFNFVARVSTTEDPLADVVDGDFDGVYISETIDE